MNRYQLERINTLTEENRALKRENQTLRQSLKGIALRAPERIGGVPSTLCSPHQVFHASPRIARAGGSL